MGTQGKKNTPITARVNAGLFNQKGGVTEPLLNVGSAGVYGNNQTRDIPSPSKMRGYTKRSPLKQEVGVNVLESSSTGDQILKGKEITKPVNIDDYDGSGGYMENDKWEAFLKTPKGKIYQEKNTKQEGTGKFEPDTVIPGTTTETNEFTPTQTRDENDAMSPWRVRQQSRTIKKTGKDDRQSKIKAARLEASGGGKMDEDGNFQKTTKLKGKERREFIKNAKNKAKVEENYAEQDAFKKNQTARTRQVEMSSDPLGESRTHESGTRNMDLWDGNKTYEGQKTIIEQGGVKKSTKPDFKTDYFTPKEVTQVVKKGASGDNPNPLVNDITTPAGKRGYRMRGPLYK